MSEDNKPLKIALLADAGHVNCQRWCEGLRSAGAEIDVISFRFNRLDDIRVHQLRSAGVPHKLCYLSTVPRVRRLLAGIKPDLLAAYYVTGYGTLAALTGFRPLVQVTSGSDILLAPSNPIMRLILRHALRQADLVTAWAPHMADAVRRLGVAQQRTLTLARGIPYDQFARNRAATPETTDSLCVVSTRSLRSVYKIDLLIKAFRLLKNEGVCFSLTIVGEGPDRDKLLKLTKQMELVNQVRFCGFVDNAKLPSILAAHNVYVSLIESDGVSASLLEAMTAGLLPIVPDHVANRYWVRDGENGIILKDLSVTTIADGLRRAISNYPIRLRAWEENIKMVSDQADLHRNAQRFVKQFHQVVKDYRELSATV